MAGMNEVLERLVTDPAFRSRLESDPAGALVGYQLDEDDLRVLAAQPSSDPGTGGTAEQRTNKSTLAGLLGGIAEAPADGGSSNTNTGIGELQECNISKSGGGMDTVSDPHADDGQTAQRGSGQSFVDSKPPRAYAGQDPQAASD